MVTWFLEAIQVSDIVDGRQTRVTRGKSLKTQMRRFREFKEVFQEYFEGDSNQTYYLWVQQIVEKKLKKLNPVQLEKVSKRLLSMEQCTKLLQFSGISEDQYDNFIKLANSMLASKVFFVLNQ